MMAPMPLCNTTPRTIGTFWHLVQYKHSADKFVFIGLKANQFATIRLQKPAPKEAVGTFRVKCLLICDVICEKGLYCGRNIIGPDQTPRMMRGV